MNIASARCHAFSPHRRFTRRAQGLRFVHDGAVLRSINQRKAEGAAATSRTRPGQPGDVAEDD